VVTDGGIKHLNIEKVRITHISETPANQLFNFGQLYTFDDDGVIKSVGEPHHSLALTLNEVYDVAYDSDTNSIAAATGSTTFVVHIFSENEAFQLAGHTNLPISLAASNGLLLSGSKDHSVRLWSLSDRSCVTTLVGHSDSVSAVAFVPNSDLILSGSSDKTLKLWRPSSDPLTKSAVSSVIAHSKEITSIAVSADGLLAATGSTDKTAKLWDLSAGSLALAGSLSGHRRGVSCVAFSPVERVVATGSSDCSVRIWQVDDCSCISTFTEFSSTVMSVLFIRQGLQLVAAESGGAVKVLRVRTGAVDFALEEAHSGQIWRVIGGSEGEIVTGSVDGRLVVWRDNSQELEEAERVAKDEMTQAEQELKNALRNQEYVAAIRLAFSLRMPNKLRLVVREVSEKRLPSLVEYFEEVTEIEDYQQWIDYIAKWSTNSHWVDDATEVITALLNVKPFAFFTENKRVFAGKIEAIVPYLERHLARLDRLSIQAYAIDDLIESADFQ
jgi:U3 small nucleolar RNA-associated protein 13